MKKKIVLLTICLLLVGAFVFSACSEKTSQKPIATDLTGATLSDNGGMAVRYGDYVYFINGYAGERQTRSEKWFAARFAEQLSKTACPITNPLKSSFPKTFTARIKRTAVFIS